ncbi:hypothetical protein K8S19_08125 [bacterium]|nr:hypothetical protein [bacterium]
MNQNKNKSYFKIRNLWSTNVILWWPKLVKYFKRMIMSLRDGLKTIITRIKTYLTIKVVRLWFYITSFSRGLLLKTSKIMIGIIGLIIASFILGYPPLRTALNTTQSIDKMLIQLGATYGTILALVLTLSIIPIQRAAEAWSSSIVRLYRRDLITNASFVALAILCIACFAFSAGGFAGVSENLKLAVAILTLGFSLDLLRLYHRHICKLLDPTYSTNLALKQAMRTIDRIKKTVNRSARLHYKLLPEEKKQGVVIEDIETIYYPQVFGYPQTINSWINDLSEIAVKAISRNEKLLTKSAVYAIAHLTMYYLSARKLNLLILPCPDTLLLTSQSDVEAVTGCSYEMLNEISRIAISQNDESAALSVSEAYKKITIHTANLGARKYRPNTAPLSMKPINYMLSCVRIAQTKGLDEVPFQTSGMLSGIIKCTPKDVDDSDIHLPVINGISEIAQYFYINRNPVLAEEVIKQYFIILDHMLRNKDYYFKEVLGQVFQKLGNLAPFAIISETLQGRLSMNHPFTKAYSLVEQTSLGNLFAMAATIFPKVDPERDATNPYYELIDMTDIIARHLRNVAEKNEFGDSFLIWEINELIKHIAKVVCQILDNPLRSNQNDVKELVDKFTWILSFYWVAFDRKKSIFKEWTDIACDSMVYIGLLFYTREWWQDVLLLCISNIRSILESYCEISKNPDDYAIGDIYAHFYAIQLVMRAKNNTHMANKVDEEIKTKPKVFTEEQWKNVQKHILLRQKQLEERLRERGGFPGPNDGEELARQILSKHPIK